MLFIWIVSIGMSIESTQKIHWRDELTKAASWVKLEWIKLTEQDLSDGIVIELIEIDNYWQINL